MSRTPRCGSCQQETTNFVMAPKGGGCLNVCHPCYRKWMADHPNVKRPLKPEAVNYKQIPDLWGFMRERLKG